MKNLKHISQLLAIIAGMLFFISCQQDENINPAIDERTTLVASSSASSNFYGLGTFNELYLYRSGPPATMLNSTTISGLRDGEVILAIDVRPSNRALYGISNQDALYQIRVTPASEPVMAAQAILISQTPFKVPLEGTLRGMDFHPQTGMIKVVTDVGQNLRIDPNIGDVVGEDMDVNTHAFPVAMNSLAYLANYGSLTGPVLYSVDVAESKLYKLDGSTGNITSVGSLGLTIMGEGGFDISTKGAALAVYEMTSGKGGVIPDPTTSMGYWLFRVDLKTGFATRLGSVQPMNGIAIQ